METSMSSVEGPDMVPPSHEPTLPTQEPLTQSDLLENAAIEARERGLDKYLREGAPEP